MRDEPDGAALLTIAEATMREVILPALPEDLHYTARMIANAMRIAARQAKADDTGEAEAIARLLGVEGGTVEALNRRLAADIRAGRLDDAMQGAAGRALLSATVARLAEVNPRALKQAQARGVVPPGFVPWQEPGA